MKNIILLGVITLCLSSCRQFPPTASPTHTSEFAMMATESMTNTPGAPKPSAPALVASTFTFASPTGLAPARWSQYIGLTYPPLPDGLSEGFGSLVLDSDYGVTLVSDHETTMLWLGRLTQPARVWKVKDIIELPEFGSDIVFIPNGCLLDKELDPTILVIGKWDDEVFVSRYMTTEKILSAWRVNTEAGIFEAMSTTGIECHADNAVLFK